MKKYLLLLSLLVISTAAAGQSRSEIHGRVTDQRNANVAGAQATLRSRTGTQLSGTSDENGAFAFKNLEPGEYVIEVKANGFASFTATVSLARGQSITQDIR
jgi:uncharacterized surface anchored protein